MSLIQKTNYFHKIQSTNHNFFLRNIHKVFVVCIVYGDTKVLKRDFVATSLLKFTYEKECNENTVFIDTLRSGTEDILTTTVFWKVRNTEECSWYENLCPLSIRTGVKQKLSTQNIQIVLQVETFQCRVQGNQIATRLQ